MDRVIGWHAIKKVEATHNQYLVNGGFNGHSHTSGKDARIDKRGEKERGHHKQEHYPHVQCSNNGDNNQWSLSNILLEDISNPAKRGEKRCVFYLIPTTNPPRWACVPYYSREGKEQDTARE